MVIGTSIVIGGSALTALALGIAVYTNSGQSSFLYANARIISRSLHILDRKRLDQLADSKTLPDMINQLKDTEHQIELGSINKNSITEFNMALERGFIDSINDIKKISPKKFRKVYDAYAKIYESKIIKTFFRSRFSNIKISKNLLEPIGSINPILLKHLHDTKTIADMKLVLRDTNYRDLFEKDFKTIEEFDFELERNVMRETHSIFKGIKVYDKKIILDIFRKRREIKQILTLLKFRIRETDKKMQKKLIHIRGIDMEKTINSKDLKEFVKNFQSTEYSEPLNNALKDFEKNDDYYGFEKELLRYHYNFIKNNDLIHSIGPYPIISYITKREIEEKNLLIIAKGIVSGLEKDKIKEMTI